MKVKLTVARPRKKSGGLSEYEAAVVLVNLWSWKYTYIDRLYTRQELYCVRKSADTNTVDPFAVLRV